MSALDVAAWAITGIMTGMAIGVSLTACVALFRRMWSIAAFAMIVAAFIALLALAGPAGRLLQ